MTELKQSALPAQETAAALGSGYTIPGPIPPGLWVQEQQSIRAGRMGRDGGTAAGVAGDNASDCGSVTTHQPEFCSQTSVGTLLPACRQQEDKLRAAAFTGRQRLLTAPEGP